jgi:hypothetical protein
MAANNALILPVGHSLGVSWDLASGTAEHRVRRGTEVITMDAERFGLWALAHGVPQRQVDEVWTFDSVLDVADEMGLADPEPLLAELLADGLLVEVDQADGASAAFARRHRMVPLMLGLGNTAEDPDVFLIGLPGRPLVGVPAVAYDLYGWAHLDPDLWTACRSAAQINEGLRPDDPSATDPEQLVGALLGILHVLLGPNTIYLDVAREDG